VDAMSSAFACHGDIDEVTGGAFASQVDTKRPACCLSGESERSPDRPHSESVDIRKGTSLHLLSLILEERLDMSDFAARQPPTGRPRLG
jgi:hypothetical protein